MNNEQQLDRLIKNMAERHHAELPGASLIWWRAQIQKKLAEKERVERPIIVAPIIAWLGCLALVGLITAWNWRAIEPLVSSGSTTMVLPLASIAAAALLMAGW